MGAGEMPRKTKIIATLGPASNSQEGIYALYNAGMTHARLNFSHGKFESHRQTYNNVDAVRRAHKIDIGTLADLPGLKNRTMNETDILLHRGMVLCFDRKPELPQINGGGYQARLSVDPAQIIDVLRPGQRFLVDDGNIRLKVSEAGDGYFMAVVENTNPIILKTRKGVNFPDTVLKVPALTAKDREIIEFAAGELGVDWIAQSFTQTGRDVLDAREVIRGRAKLIAKIETPEALRNFREILAYADAVMVARGDLGVEIPFYEVPIVQRLMVEEGRRVGKPVIVATQMMESMIKNPSPTRAEASDVSVAVAHGASAVMLSAESATGDYPVEAVEAMNLIVRSREKFMHDPHSFLQRIFGDANLSADTLAELPPPAEFCTWEVRRRRGEPGPVHIERRSLVVNEHLSMAS